MSKPKIREETGRCAWKNKSKTVVYNNPWIQVNHEIVINPSGEESIYGVVQFKNHAVGILPVDDRGGTWLVQQSRYPNNDITWEIPEGGAPKNEDILLAAKRELQEETGLRAKQWQHWLDMQLSNSVTDEKATIYLARDLLEGDTAHEETEDITVHYLPLKEAISMVFSGKIVDAISVAALLKAATYRNFQEFL
jgi:8-oxo-dGTP pyrophosphatase MutT (NUDIX family)